MYTREEKRKLIKEFWIEVSALLMFAIMMLIGMIVTLYVEDFEENIPTIITIFGVGIVFGIISLLQEIFYGPISRWKERVEEREKVIRKHFGIEEGTKRVKYRKFRLQGIIKGIDNKLMLFYEHKRTREKITVIQEGYREEVV